LKNKNLFNIAAIVLARGGSKGIPKKNIVPFCGKPLIEWTILQLQDCIHVNTIWVSSDSPEILKIAENIGSEPIERPVELAADKSTSESAILHALEVIEKKIGKVDLIVHPQITSPIRDSMDFSNAISQFLMGDFDSMFSANRARDLCLWSKQKLELKCESYDKKNPYRRRQDTFGERYIENGSFYLILPEVLRTTGLRFGDKIGTYLMDYWKMFEIDEPEDVAFCEVVMKAFLQKILS